MNKNLCSEIILPTILQVAKEKFYNNNLLIKLRQDGLIVLQQYIEWSLHEHIILEADVREAYHNILNCKTADEAESIIAFLLLGSTDKELNFYRAFQKAGSF